MNTKTEMKHTPRPWKLDGNLVIDANGKEVPWDGCIEIALKAVNSHEELLEAAKNALKWLENSSIHQVALLDGQPKGFGLNHLRKAIAKAEGK